MASELTVQTIKGPLSGDNANKIIIPAGQTLEGLTESFPSGSVIGYHRHVHTGTVYMDSSTLVQIGQQVSYTPKKDNSILVAKHTIVARAAGGNAECRIKFAFNINGGSTGIVGPVGTYDYDNSGGLWNLNNYVFTTNHQVTTTAYPWTWDLFGATQNDTQGNGGFFFNENANENAGFITQTEIWEIKQ